MPKSRRRTMKTREVHTDNVDYRLSHTGKGKGVSYDRSFQREGYRKYIWHWEQEVLSRILRRYFATAKPGRYLDFACGTGRIADYLESAVIESIGVDVSEEMLLVAKNRLQKTKLVRADLTRETVFETGYFDLITAFRFFLNAQSSLREDALDALHSVIKGDGLLVLNIHMNGGCLLEGLLRAYLRIVGKAPNFNTVSYDQMRAMLARSGFEIAATYHYGIVPIYNEDAGFPRFVVVPIDWVTSQFVFFRRWSRYVIYVCKPCMVTSCRHPEKQAASKCGASSVLYAGVAASARCRMPRIIPRSMTKEMGSKMALITALRRSRGAGSRCRTISRVVPSPRESR